MSTSIEYREQMNARLKNFALRIIKRYQALPQTGEAQMIEKQVLRSATSRARSGNEFFSKLSIITEEADETPFGTELIGKAMIVPEKQLESIIRELEEILKIMAQRAKTPSQNNQPFGPSILIKVCI